MLDRKLADLGQMCEAGFYASFGLFMTKAKLKRTTYPGDWVSLYNSKRLFITDPVVRWAISNKGSQRWSNLARPKDCGGMGYSDPADVFGKAKEFGLNFGLVISLRANSFNSIVSLANTNREFTDDELARTTELVHEIHDLVC